MSKRNEFCLVAVPGGFAAGRPGDSCKVYPTAVDAIAALAEEERARVEAASASVRPPRKAKR